jgi:arabinofuranosyltransferase
MTLKDAFSTEKPLLAVTAAGCLPFWSELPSVDMLGLNDYYLPRHRPENMGIGFLGHELGNIDYILGLAPDIVVFHTGVQPEYGFGAELLADTSFARNYRKLRVATAVSPHYTALIWIRERSARVGIKRENGKITIPAYLINASDQTIASLADDHFVVHIDSDHPAGVEVPDVSKWDAVIVASQNSDNINCRAEPSGRGVLISLTTNSPKPLAVDSIILRTTASADSDVSPKTVTPGISCSGASTCVINPGDDLPKHHP